MFIKRCPAHFSQNLGFCTWNILVYEHFTLWMWFKVKLMRHNDRTTGKWFVLYAANIMLPKTTPKYQYPPFPLFSYFSVGVCLRCLLLNVFCYLLYIHSGETGNLFSLLLCSLWWVQIVHTFFGIRFGLNIVFVYLYITPSYYHHCANLSEDIKVVKYLSDIFCRVCKIKHIISIIHYTICGVVCFQFTNFPCDGWENIHTLSYNHHQIGSMNHYPLFRVRSLYNGMRCIFFYILLYFILILFEICLQFAELYIDWIVQERRNSIAKALELRLSCINPST